MQYCFIGLESYNWTLDQYTAAGQAIKAAGYDTAIFKLADGPNRWFDDAGEKARFMALSNGGVWAVPYTFCYGNSAGSSVASEVAIANRYLSLFGVVVLDMESGFDGKAEDAQAFARGLDPHGEVYISTWANLVDHNWLDCLKAFDKRADGFMPQVYTSYLLGVYISQSVGISIPIMPTFSKDTLYNNISMQNCGYWEYADLKPIGGPKMQTVVNVPQVSQFEPGETQFACGFFAVAMLKYANLPGQQARGTAEQIDQLADQMYTQEYGSADISQLNGIGVDQLHNHIKQQGMHYFDILAINDTSSHQSDADHIRAAVKAGYPVIATIYETSVYDFGINANPYAWGPAGTHVICIVGIDPNGNYACFDPANITGQLNGANSTRPWPRIYDAMRAQTPFATVVQVPWLGFKQIPSGDPTAWPAGFTAIDQVTDAQRQAWVAQEFKDCWESVFREFQNTPPSMDTGICKSWQKLWLAGKQVGPALTHEYASVNMSGQKIICQQFAGGRCEWDQQGVAHWFGPYGDIK